MLRVIVLAPLPPSQMSVGLLLYAAYGYSLTFTSFSPFMGGGGRLLLLGEDVEYTHVLHQFSFAATTGTIVSGVLAERVCFKAYLVLASWIISVLYSIAAHWVWTSEGWLAQIRFFDFAGAGVVHLLGGACACVATCYVGPRIGLWASQHRQQHLAKLAVGRATMHEGGRIQPAHASAVRRPAAPLEPPRRAAAGAAAAAGTGGAQVPHDQRQLVGRRRAQQRANGRLVIRAKELPRRLHQPRRTHRRPTPRPRRYMSTVLWRAPRGEPRNMNTINSHDPSVQYCVLGLQ